MADKKKELECIEKVLNCKTVKGQFARDKRETLIQKKEYIDCSGERTDIIIKDDSGVIGIEHCQVDVLFKTKKKMHNLWLASKIIKSMDWSRNIRMKNCLKKI